MFLLRQPALAAMLASMLCAGHARSDDGARPQQLNPTIDPRLVAAGFLDGHPDLLHRDRGLKAYGKQDHEAGYKAFRRAAWYADKPSQAIVGEMLWKGVGVPRDRALGYVWMDLAAERGYRSFSEKRDLYWNALTPEERARAATEGVAIRVEYRDAAAEPRLAAAMERERRSLTGSRLGSLVNPVAIEVPGVGSIAASEYYHPRYWDPALYRQWQDSIWQELRIGRVSVGAVEDIGAADSPTTGPSAPAQTESPDDP